MYAIPWRDEFDDAALPIWDLDRVQGTATVSNSQLHLDQGRRWTRTFPLLWAYPPFPADDWELSVRFRYSKPTPYGTTIGVGTALYEGARYPMEDAPVPGVEDVLSIHQLDTEFRIRLWDHTVWRENTQDTAWHIARLDRRNGMYTLYVDDVRVASMRRDGAPQSMYIGNPSIQSYGGPWTPLNVDYVRLEVCTEWGW